jgi:hypothetical protein
MESGFANLAYLLYIASFFFCLQVLNNSSTVVAEVFISRLSSKVTVHPTRESSLSPVQLAVLFGGLAFQVCALFVIPLHASLIANCLVTKCSLLQVKVF